MQTGRVPRGVSAHKILEAAVVGDIVPTPWADGVPARAVPPWRIAVVDGSQLRERTEKGGSGPADEPRGGAADSEVDNGGVDVRRLGGSAAAAVPRLAGGAAQQFRAPTRCGWRRACACHCLRSRGRRRQRGQVSRATAESLPPRLSSLSGVAAAPRDYAARSGACRSPAHNSGARWPRRRRHELRGRGRLCGRAHNAGVDTSVL